MERQSVAGAQNSVARMHGVQRQSERNSPALTLLEVQRSIGNRATQRLLNSTYIQTKLQVSAPEDPFEQEADRTAETVMRMSERSVSTQVQAAPLSSRITPFSPRESDPVDEKDKLVAPKSRSRIPLAVREDDEEVPIQRVCEECEEDASVQRVRAESGAESRIDRKDNEVKNDGGGRHTGGDDRGLSTIAERNIHGLSGGGSPLSATSRAFFEPRFGVDFSPVRVHVDAHAADIAKSINAKAFTVGRDIAFGAGQFVPESSEGQRLLAHELTHVVQQNGDQLPQLHTQPAETASKVYAPAGSKNKSVCSPSLQKGNSSPKADHTNALSINQAVEPTELESENPVPQLAVAVPPIAIQHSPPGRVARDPGPPTDVLPAPVQVVWGGDPFTISFERKKEDTDYFYFIVRYTGPHPADGPSVEQKTTRFRVALGTAPLNASVVPLPGQQVVVDLYGFRDHLVRLVDEVKFDNRSFAFGREHDLTAKSQGRFAESGSLWVHDPNAKPLDAVIAEPQLPAFASAATPVFIGGISSVDVVLGQYNDQFRISVQSQATSLNPTYPIKATLGVAPIYHGQMLYGKGLEISVNGNPNIRVLSAGGNSISIDLDGDRNEDLHVEDAINVPADYDGGGPAEYNRNHTVSLSGPGVPARSFEFHVRMGSFVRGSSDTAIDQKATSNAHAVSELSREHGPKGTFDEQLDTYEIAFMPYRKQAVDDKLITQKTFDSWKNLSEAMIKLRVQIDANQRDPQKNPIDESVRLAAMLNATELYDSLAAETLAHEIGSGTEVSSTSDNPYTGESTTIVAFAGATTTTGPAKQVSFNLFTRQWDKAYQSYHALVNGLDRWIVDQMKAKKGETDPNFQRAQAIASMHGALGDLAGKKPIRVLAVFHPDKKFASEGGYMPTVPLQLYAWRDGDDWYLRDITNPSEPYTFPTVSADATQAPPVGLFRELDDPDHYPAGVIHYDLPGYYGGQIQTRDRLTWKKFFTWLGIGLAVIGLAISAVATAGTTLELVGAWALAGSAVAGGTAAAIDLIEGGMRGNLTEVRVAIDLAQIVASIAGVSALRSSMVVRGALTAAEEGAPLMGRAAEYAVYMQKVYLVAKGTQLAADTITLAIVGVEIAIQLEDIEKSDASRAEKDRAKLLLLSQLAVMGGIHILAVKGDLPLLTGGGRRLTLHFPDNQGPPVATLTGMEAPSSLRFSQKDIAPTTGDQSMTLEQLAESIRQGWKGPPIDVVPAPDGSLVSLDNRRLMAAQMAGVKEIPVAYHSPSEPFPPARANAPEFKLKNNIRRLADGTLVVGGSEGEIVFPKDFRPTNFGEAAMVRTANQGNLPAGAGRFLLWGRLEQPGIRSPRPPGTPGPATPTQLGKQIGEAAGGNLGDISRQLSDLHLQQVSASEAAEAALWATGMRPARPVTLDDLSVAVPIAQEGRGQPILLIKLDGSVVRAKADLSWEGWGMRVTSVQLQ